MPCHPQNGIMPPTKFTDPYWIGKQSVASMALMTISHAFGRPNRAIAMTHILDCVKWKQKQGAKDLKSITSITMTTRHSIY
jgi:hypothetical protein